MRFHQVALTWFLQLVGAGKFIDRVLHVPEDALSTAAALAGVSNEQWRRVEQVQKAIVREGIAVKVPGAQL